MTKNIVLLIIVIGIALNANAQNSLQLAASEIVSNSLTLKAMALENQIKILDDRSKIIPSDPEIIGAYLWGSPSYIGERKNLNVHQKLKFPTYYYKQKKFNKLSAEFYGMDLDAEVNKVLFESLDLMIDLVHVSVRQEMIEKRLERLRHIHKMAVGMFESGETNRIELEKASLLVDTYQQDLLMLISEKKILSRQLMVLNGGQELDIRTMEYSDFEELYSNSQDLDVMANNPMVEKANIKKQLAEADIEIAKTAYLPDFQFGFVREAIRDEKLAGVEFGLSIPLWGKANEIKKAKLSSSWSGYGQRLTRLTIKSDWDNLNEMATQSIEIKGNLEASLGSLKSKTLLEESWKLGEISLLDYLKELPFYYGVEDRVIEAEQQYYKSVLNRNRNHLTIMIGL